MEKYIIYDDKCEFCTKFSQWCVRKNHKFKTLPIRSKEARHILKQKGIQFIDLNTIHLVDGEYVFNRSKAVFQIFNNFNFPYFFISLGKFLPQIVTDFFYKIFAKYRYKIASKTEN